MNSLTEDVKHEAERGEILKVLVDWDLEWMPFYELRLQIESRTGRRLSDDQVKFHLNYLDERGYTGRKLLRPGVAGVQLLVVRATSKAADLIAGLIEPDPGVAL
jgi:repressor of nif and glnA expression